jgi:type II secretory pathway pseudopilin PulG
MHRNERGMTLAEVLVSIGILAVLIFATLTVTSVAMNSSRRNMDKQFAVQKAMAILEELKAVAQGANSQGGVVILDQYDDGAVKTNPLLTIQLNTLPADPVSGNQSTGTNTWLYARHIAVQNVGTAGATVRRVTVSIYKNVAGGQQVLAEVTSIIRTLSNTMPQSQVYDVYAVAIENVPGWWTYTANLVPFVQNAINNLQARNAGLTFRVHWITKLAMGRDQEYRPAMNHGCDTWGNKLAGAPAALDCTAHNALTTATSNAFDWVYFYPGALPVDATANPPALSEYYPAGSMNAHVTLDGAEYNDYAAANLSATPPVYGNPHPYALADQYNHAMRYYDERNLVNARIADKVDTEPTYRMLIDDMTLNPNKYINAILINLHGELMPFPPIRNYSDAAKDPEQTASPNLQFLRVVTHPENLTSNSSGTTDTTNYTGTGDFKLRVYAYEAPLDAKAPAGSPYDQAAYLPTPITVLIKGLNLVGDIDIQRMTGGTKQTTLIGSAPANDPYALSAAPTAVDGPNTPKNGMWATIAASGSDTLITLYNTPYRTPACKSGSCGSSTYNGQGLAAGHELYGMQYIPSPLENFATTASNPVAFSTDLDSTANEKNTARWVIRVTRGDLNAAMTAAWNTTNAPLTIETRLGTDLTTGVLYPTRNHPANLSRTYHWRGTDLWLYGDGTETNPPNLPMSERYQFMGDPRHCPYADLKRPHVTNTFKNGAVSNEHRLGMGYNRYFDDFEDGSTNAAADWPGWTYTVSGVKYGVKNGDGDTTNDGWTGGPQLEIDVPRAFGIFRTAITASQAVYTTMTGWSYYYIGIGGEIGYDAANQFTNSIPVLGKPFSGSTGQQIYEQSIINDAPTPAQGSGVKYIRATNTSSNYWWSLNWLGELYPDSAYTGTYGYMNTGNLPSGTINAQTFRRVLRGAIDPSGAAPSWPLPAGTTFGSGSDAAVRRLMGNGSTTFFSTGTPTSTFHHTSTTGSGSLILEGLTMAASASGYNFPLLNPIPNNRPFSLTMNATGPDSNAFLQTAYGSPFAATPPAAFPVTQQTLFYQEQTPLPGSGLFSLRDPVTNRVAFVVVNGLSPTGQSGSQFIANWSFLSLLHSFFVGGLYNGDLVACTGCPFRVAQLPRVSITSPNQTTYLNDPSTINVTWSLAWFRWDGKKYTPTYSNTFAETTPIQYQFSYSKDNGKTWFYQDDTPSLGVGIRLPSGDSRILTGTSVTWNTPASSFPQSNYLIRVEAYRANLSMHYSFHQFRAYIWRQ